MIPIFLLSMAMDPDIVTFRHNSALAAWRQCIVVAADKFKQSPDLKDADDVVLDLSKAMCEKMAEDFRNTLPDYLYLFGKKKGLNNSGAEALAKAMGDETFRLTEQTLTLTGEAAPIPKD